VCDDPSLLAAADLLEAGQAVHTVSVPTVRGYPQLSPKH
jgi:hypothetical protein